MMSSFVLAALLAWAAPNVVVRADDLPNTSMTNLMGEDLRPLITRRTTGATAAALFLVQGREVSWQGPDKDTSLVIVHPLDKKADRFYVARQGQVMIPRRERLLVLVVPSPSSPRPPEPAGRKPADVVLGSLQSPEATAERVTVPAGDGAEEAHADRLEIWWISKGNGEIVVDGEAHAFGPETAIYLAPGRGWRFRANAEIQAVRFVIPAPTPGG
jgi:mannose-6-phosphate isomerase-like protein (cupin superfamily)